MISPPAVLQQAALAAGAPLGRLLGYQPHTTRRVTDTRPHTRPDRRHDRGRPGQPRAQESRRLTFPGRMGVLPWEDAEVPPKEGRIGETVFVPRRA
jgi:hypothetical protein